MLKEGISECISMNMSEFAVIFLAKEGWRYIGFIPAIQRGTGHIEEMDLIFEREQQ